MRKPMPSVEEYDARPASREDRARRTHELLLEAHGCTDAEQRRQLLDQVVLLNRGVAESVAARYRNRGVATEDLEQTAFEGLVKAVQKFDPTVRPDLLTYAVPTIRGEVQRLFRDHSWTIRPPRSIQELQWRISRSIERLSVELGREPSTDELAKDLERTPEEVSAAIRAFGSFKPASLDKVVREDGLTLADLLVEEQGAQSAAEARLVLAPLLRDLSARERRILYLRFFEEKSQAEIGAELGVTQMQVSRLLKGILRGLREQSETLAEPPVLSPVLSPVA